MRNIVTQVLEVVALEKCEDDDILSMVVVAQTKAPLEDGMLFSATFKADRGELELGDDVIFSIQKVVGG